MHPQGTTTPELLLADSDEKARSYEWTSAAELAFRAYEMRRLSENSADAVSVLEFSAFCNFRSAFQSSERNQFEERMRTSETLYAQSAVLYERASSEPFWKRAKAQGLYAGLWLLKDENGRRGLLSKCIELALEAEAIFQGEGDEGEVAETHAQLLPYLREALDLATDWHAAKSQFDRAEKIGRKTIEECEHLGRRRDLLDAMHFAAWLGSVYAQAVLEPSKYQALAGDNINLGRRVMETSRIIGTKHALCVAKETEGDIAFNVGGDYDRAVKLYREAAESAIAIRDSLISGRLFWRLTAGASWSGPAGEDVNHRREVLQKGIESSELALKHLEIPYDTTYLAAVCAKSAECHISLAISVESEALKKKELLQRAINLARRGATYCNRTWAWQLTALALVRATYFLSSLEEDAEEKTRLLIEALPIAEQAVGVTDLLFPHFWNRGVVRNYLALIKSELGRTEKDVTKKLQLVQSAVEDMQQCLDLCSKWATVPGLMRRVAGYFEWFGDILLQLYQLKNEPENSIRAVQAYQEAGTYFDKSGAIGPQGALSWKIAKVHDSLGNFIEASQSFKKASEEYRRVGKQISALTITFNDLAIYMEGWANIEEARRYHSEEKYDRSHEMYRKAAEILEATKTWRGLAMLLHARSSLEKGEALSRREKHDTAAEYLKKALDRSRLSRNELEKMRATVVDALERREIDDWIRIAEHREAYATGRIELEEGRALDESGDKIASARKYRSAFHLLKMLGGQTVAAEDRAEIDTFAQLCNSLALRKEAESKSSPELFAQAAESFARAKESATSQSFGLRALGDASICRALEFGTKFRQSRDIRLYSDVKRHLEVAADHYTEAGFRKTASWTRATQRVFDAVMLLTDAEVELDVKKKRELYHLAEKDYALAAKLYGEAGFASKKRDALEQLKRAREGKEVFLSPLETLEEIPPVSATHLPQIPLRGAQPLGLERFEDAKVTGELRTPQTHITMGSDFTVNIDIANVGKTPATLIKLEGIVPEGCEPVGEQGTPGLEGNSLDLRGKRLEYLKAHGVQVYFRPTRKGEFELSPRVVYVDEKGNYKSTNLKPLYLTVREPSISEGLHAPPTVHLPQDFQFENERSRQVFSRLVKEFLDDYMTRRIVMERAGWRSLMDLIRDVKIPRSALYGPGGRTGPVLAELERRGLVETRVFPKERGRGGEIKKVRVAYENTIVRRIVDRAVMENA